MIQPVTAYGIGPVAAPTLADRPPAGSGVIPFPGGFPVNFWESSAFGLILLLLAFAYVTGRLMKG